MIVIEKNKQSNFESFRWCDSKRDTWVSRPYSRANLDSFLAVFPVCFAAAADLDLSASTGVCTGTAVGTLLLS